MMEPPVRTPRPAVGHEGMPVGGMDEADGGEDEDEDGDEFDRDHHVVGRGRLADAADQDHGEQQDDEKGGDIETEVPAGVVEVVAGQVLEAVGEIGGGDPLALGCRPNQSSRSTTWAAKPTLTLMLEPAYSRIRSQPMIQATSSPSVA